MSFTAFLTSTASSTRAVETISATGQKTITNTATLTSTACRIEQLNGTLAMTILGRQPTATHLIFFPAGTNVLENDKVTISSVVYLILEVNSVAGGIAGHHIECVGEEID